ncbi:aminomethyltransferase beta-barrel domain-containing protein, partial [Aliarcobacter butzleri]|uniref:aminomethyltransferase beta-barrel domain-containing protein n=1 Tax=Aliarcobacter butzleri TaxID=28197 RepID=UPI003AF9F493
KFSCHVQLRYRSVSTPCEEQIKDERACITLKEPVFGGANGQLAVYYDNQKVNGRAWRESTK